MLEKYLLSGYNVLNKVADMMDTNHPSGQNHKVAADLTGTGSYFLCTNKNHLMAGAWNRLKY